MIEALRTRRIGVGILSGMLALLPAAASAATGQVTLEVPAGSHFGFDVETAATAPATAASTDVRTHTNTTVGHRQLVAINGAAVAKLASTDLASVGCAEMRTASFASFVFTGADGTVEPVPGTIFVVRSRVDGYAKMQIVSVKTTAPKGLVLNFVTSLCPLDSTPPDIAATVFGPEGSGDWYVGPVDVSWTVADAESGIISTEGCDAVTLTDDTQSATVTCSAVSAGGSSSASVTVAIDQTPPDVSYEGNRDVYDIDEQVTIRCVATDQTSGVASDTCESVDAAAHDLGPGDHAASAEATDVAGNTGSGSTAFRVVVTPDGVANLIVRLVPDSDLARVLQTKASKVSSAANAHARDGALDSFENFVSAKTGKGIDPAAAHVLITAVRHL